MNLVDQPMLNIWGGGQLLAFSGSDGYTDCELLLRSMADIAAFEVKLPQMGGLVVADLAPPAASFIGSDHFELELRTGEKLRAATCAEIEKFQLKYSTFFEFYDDRCECDPPQLLRKGSNDVDLSPYHQAFSDYGWSATRYVDMLFSKTRVKAIEALDFTENKHLKTKGL
jgi:hypothetical protein